MRRKKDEKRKMNEDKKEEIMIEQGEKRKE